MVYFISDGDYIKIGMSNSPFNRLNALNTASPHHLELINVFDGDSKLEFRLHRLFKEYRVNGEWFDLPKKYYNITISEINKIDSENNIVDYGRFKDKYKFNKATRKAIDDYWGNNIPVKSSYSPFTKKTLIMFGSLSKIELKLLFSIVTKVNKSPYYLNSGGDYITFKKHSNIISVNSYYKAIDKLKKLNFLIPVGFDYYIFNNNYINLIT